MRIKPIVLAMCLAASTGVAQVPQPGAGQPPAPTPRISISFKGGTVEQYLAALREAAPKDLPVNIVASKDFQSVQIPPVELTDTSVYAALAALTVLVPRSEYAVDVKPLAQWNTGGQGDANAFAIEAQRRFMPPGPQSLKVVSVRDLLSAEGADPSERVSAETLLTAVKTALGEVPGAGDPPPEVKFHAESGLLIVRASDVELEAVKQVVKELGSSVRSDQAARRIAAARKLDMTRCEQRVAIASRTMENLRQRLQQVVKLQEAGSAPASEVLALELEVARAESEMIVARAEREAAAEGVVFTPTGSADDSELAKRVAALEQLIAELRSQSPAAKPTNAAKGAVTPANTK